MKFTIRFLSYPKRTLIYGVVFLLSTLILNNTLFHIWRLQRDNRVLQAEAFEFRSQTQALKHKLSLISTSSFIQRKAAQEFNLVKDDEMIFIFTDSHSKDTN